MGKKKKCVAFLFGVVRIGYIVITSYRNVIDYCGKETGVKEGLSKISVVPNYLR